ncbi:MAG TPA: helix-turn-helix domain-containing protein [Candidatus Brachybacterium merdavium]|uniref:Helix-turn-helix domain-containing protein n=1 Tax=Candidatus Brachybacterium merdavium TaxID=2838513 RepID=A0A9D2RPC2_9MICO|nr:helix-turn-helix domain-containing protein [Candidatus Brachybacterium merdavium]
MTAADVADVLSISARTLANWRSLNMGPDYVKVGGRVRYRVSSVNIWVARQEHKSAV